MAIRSLFAATRRLISSVASPTHAVNKPLREATTKETLWSTILKLKSPTQRATTVLQNWIESGNKVTVTELRCVLRQLKISRRYHHALEILTWKEAQTDFKMTADDQAMKLELLIQVRGLKEAEEYFNHMSSNTDLPKKAFAPFPLLLSGYVKERNVEKAEALMRKLNALGLILEPHPFNEMMKLYVATSQYEKVPLVIMLMKKNKICRNVLSYNLWMEACAKFSGIEKVEMVYKEMLGDKYVKVGWSTLATLANIYTKAGLVEKAVLALKNAEKKLSTSKRLGYFFLITLYASLNKKDEVLRLWEASKLADGRITCTNYLCILSCLVKLGDLAEAERIFKKWESKCQNYDIRVSNVLLGAYMRNGLVEKAELLHLHTLERGGHPNFKTWEILTEGWLRSQNMVKAIDAMKKGLAVLKNCKWNPSHSTLMAFVEFFEKHGSFEEANLYIKDIHQLGLGSLPLYKSLLRIHLSAKKPAHDILDMMEKDKIEVDDETSSLIQALSIPSQSNL
ncbi:hypothetical protein SLE2022_325670 [Rubroshorea leprosula]